MPVQLIEDILLEFEGDDLSQYGLFPLFAWYLTDVIHLTEYFEQVTVKRKRNHKKPKVRRTPKYNDVQMCIGLTGIIVLGINRFRKINNLLSGEGKLAELLGLPGWFDQSTAHSYLNEFHKSHVKQLDHVNTQLLQTHGESTRQDFLVVDIDSQTHTLESRKRQGAVVGRNRKKPGKPCYQWNVAFVRGEAVSQRLMAGNTQGRSILKWLIEDVTEKLGKSVRIVRLDGGYLSGEILDYIVDRQLQICMAACYD